MHRFTSLALASVAVAATPAAAQSDHDSVEITVEQIAPGIAVLYGGGGNMGLSYGDDGTILIDDQFAPLSAKIEAAIAALGAQPVQYVVNTHWHSDHADGNKAFGAKGATIFAHDNVRVRLAAGGQVGPHDVPPAPHHALPVVTFGQGLRFHVNGDTINVLYLGGGHTDGDSVVMWEEANVVHMGDLFLKIGSFPFVDRQSGGDVHSMMTSLDTVLAVIDDETKVIPGHGAMSNKAELAAERAMIGDAVAKVEALHKAGKTLEQVIAEKPLAQYGREGGFVGPDGFVTAIWRSLED